MIFFNILKEKKNHIQRKMPHSACERGIYCADWKMLDCCTWWPTWSYFLLLQWFYIYSLYVQRSLGVQLDVSVMIKAAEWGPTAACQSKRSSLFVTECRYYRTLDIFSLPHQISTQEGANESSKSAGNIWQFLWIFFSNSSRTRDFLASHSYNNWVLHIL